MSFLTRDTTLRSIAQRDKTGRTLETQTNRVLKRQNRVSTNQRFLNSDTTQKDFQKRFISREINQIIDRREIELSCNSVPTQAQGR